MKISNDSSNRLDYAPPLASIPVTSEEFRNDKFLLFCSILNIITQVASICSALLHMIIVWYPCNHAMLLGDFVSVSAWSGIICRVFAIGFNILLYFQEYENVFIFKQFVFMESWIARGLFIFFCSNLQIIVSESNCTNECPFDKLTYLVALALALIGVAYFTLGCFCFQQIRLRHLTQIRKKKQVVLQAQRLAHHKSEIEILLKETETKMQYYNDNA